MHTIVLHGDRLFAADMATAIATTADLKKTRKLL